MILHAQRATRLLLGSLWVPILAIFCLAQDRSTAPANPDSANLSVLVVRVQGPDGAAFPTPADVSLARTNADVIHESTQAAGEVQFSRLAPGNYSVVVAAAGYKPAEDQVTVDATGGELQALIRLEPIASEPAIESSIATGAVPPNLQKDVSKGLEALHAGKWDDAQNQFEILYKRDPDEPSLCYLLGYVFLRKSGVQQAGAQIADQRNAGLYLLRAASMDPHNGAAFAALGELRLEQGDFADAAAMLGRAVLLDTGNWSAHWSLASVYLRQQRYEEARAEADAAVKAGRGAANGAEFLIGQADADLGDTSDAIEALQAFLRDSPADTSVPAAQALMEKLTSDEQEKEKAAEIRAAATAELAKSAMTATPHSNSPATGADPDANLALPVWAPPGVDEVHPAVASGVNCSLTQILARAELNVQNLVSNIGNIDAAEETTHEELNETGSPVQTTKRHYDYVANFEEIRRGNLTLNEYRNGNPAPDVFSGGIAASGLTSMALVFHPYLLDDFQMTCEGLGDWHGHPAWIVYFRQRENKEGRISGYTVNGTLYRLSLKGRAWIAKDSYQIVHIETDLVRPMPQIQLTLQHMAVDYSPVHFRAGRDVWLPSTANMYFEFRRRRLHERDSYSRYKFFSTSASQQIANPPIIPPDINAP